MSENIVLQDLTKPENLATLKDYLLRLGEDADTIYTETAPNGSLSARRGKIAIYLNGSAYEFWQNTDGGTTWQRIDGVPFSYLDTDGTLAANSDTKVASQKATKTYADTKVIAPATNTADKVPQWNGANSKTLKDGLTVGTSASNLVQLDGSAKLPAVDGSQLTNLPSTTQVNTVISPNVGYSTETTGLSVAKTITSGKTVLLIASGYITSQGTNQASTIQLKQGSTVVQTISVGGTGAGARDHPWALSGVVTGLSGSITFTVTFTASSGSATGYGGLEVLEF